MTKTNPNPLLFAHIFLGHYPKKTVRSEACLLVDDLPLHGQYGCPVAVLSRVESTRLLLLFGGFESLALHLSRHVNNAQMNSQTPTQCKHYYSHAYAHQPI